MSEIANFINQNQENLFIFLAFILPALIVWTVYLQYSLAEIKKRSRVFFLNRGAKDLESIIYGQIKKTNEMDEALKKSLEENMKIKNDLEKCIQKVGIVRFNPFGDVGSNQSFAIALLDNNLNGVMILSLYSRDGVRIYSKAIKRGKAEYKLSKEEEEAIELANRKS